MNADDLAKILDELGKRLGPTGEHVFELAVRQVYIDSIITAVVSFAVIAVSTVLAVAGYRFLRREWTVKKIAYQNRMNSNDPYRYQSAPSIEDHLFPAMFGVTLLVAVVLTAGGAFTDALSKLLNPEYAALRALIGAVR